MLTRRPRGVRDECVRAGGERVPQMDADEIRACVKHSIASIANLDPASIPDDASYKKDLSLDSLTILEIAVETECAFKIRIDEEELSCMHTVSDTVKLIQQRLCVTAA